ncbi:MAG: CsbD family protein [Pirellulaceae bacterium]
MTTRQETSGNWKQLTGKVKEKYGQITDNDLTRVQGNIEQLVGLVQQKTGQTREQIEAFLEECGASCESMLGRASEYASSAAGSLKEGYDNVAEQTKRGYDASMKAVARHPLESVGTAFSLGVVAGLLIGLSMGAQHERNLSWRERWMR